MFEETIDLKGKNDKFKECTKSERPGKKYKKHWFLKTQRNFLKEDKKSLMVLKAKVSNKNISTRKRNYNINS